MDNISPKYQMDLVEKIDRVIWEIFPSYQKVEFYIMKWHMEDRDWNNPWENFYIVKKEDNKEPLANSTKQPSQYLLSSIF